MATTITATPDTATGSIQLSITQTSSVTKVVRSDGNGIAEVRVSAGQLPSPSSGTTILTDYEASQGVNNYTAYVTDTAVVRTNLVTNPSSGAATTGYSALAGTSGVAAISRVTSGGTTTATFARCTWTTATTAASGGILYGSTTGLTAGTTYTFSAYVRPSITQNLTLSVDWNNAGGGYLSTTLASPVSVTANTWTRLSVTATAPANATQVSLYAQVTTGSTVWPIGATLDYQGLLIETGSTLQAFFDGATATSGDYSHAWTSTANASTSTEILTTRLVTATATLTLAKPWLMVPIAPNYSETVEAVTNYGAGRSSNSTVHQIIGRADPLVVLGKLGTRTGTLEIWTDSVASANKLARVFDRGEIVMLKQADNAGMDMYFTAEDLDISPFSVAGVGITKYKFTVNYHEVVRPYGNLAGALGWTFNALASRYATFDQILADYATFDALTLGGI